MSALLLVGTGPAAWTADVTAALAALHVDRGARCTVVVPASTGVRDDEPADVPERLRAAAPGADVIEFVRYPQALSPAAAARCSGRPALDPAVCAAAVLDADRDGGVVLVHGGDGLLVRYDDDGFTMAGLARSLRLPLVLVADAEVGGVNAAALTLEAAAHRGLELVGVVVAPWPAEPGAVARSAVADLEMLAARPLLGALPERLPPAPHSVAVAHASLGPALGGAFDAAAFRRNAVL